MAFEEVGSAGGDPFPFDKAGDALEGSYVDKTDEIEGEHGLYRIWSFDVEGDTRTFIAGEGSILEGKLLKADFSVGDLGRVEFLGLQKAKKSGREYKNWSVQIDRQKPKTNWDDKAAF